jgi:hypothetical protein
MRALATFGLGLVLAAWSCATMLVDFVTYPYRAVAERLETGATADLEYFAGISGALRSSESLAACSRDMVRSAASIKLAGIDAALRTVDPAVSASALSEASDVIKEGLRCFPLDGNLWLRLAMVEFARTGPKADVQGLLALSVTMAPRERWIIMQRIAFTAKLFDLKLLTVSEILRADIKTFIEDARVEDVRHVYSKAGQPSRGIFRELIARLGAGRRNELQRALEG